MIIKILLAICVFVMTVISIGFKTINNHERFFYNRLRTSGYIAIFVAICIFILGSINEYNSSIEKRNLERKVENLNENLKDSRENQKLMKGQMAQSIQETMRANKILNIIDKSSRGKMTRHKYSLINYNDINLGRNDLSTENGKYIKPYKGDRIKWNIICTNSSNDEDELNLQSGKYGTMIANYERIDLNEKKGKFIFKGTNSTGGNLTFGFYNSKKDSIRLDLLQRNNCRIEVVLDRELKNIQLSLLDERQIDYVNSLDRHNSRLCEQYERLYPSKSCDSY